MSNSPAISGSASVRSGSGSSSGTSFIDTYTGRSSGVLRWPQLDALWLTVQASAAPWYVYKIGTDVPGKPASAAELKQFIEETDAFLREIHDEKYCGVVYTDSFDAPTLLKIYHPKKMGAGCGSAGHTILPLWTLSTLPPSNLLDWAAKKDQKPAWWKFMMKTS